MDLLIERNVIPKHKAGTFCLGYGNWGRTRPLSLSSKLTDVGVQPHSTLILSIRVRGSSHSHPKRPIPYVDIPPHPIHSSSSHKDITMADPETPHTSSSKWKANGTNQTMVRKCKKGQRKDGTFQTECTITLSENEVIIIHVRKDGKWFCHCSKHDDPCLYDNQNTLQQHYRRAQVKAKKQKINLKWNVSTFTTPNDIPHSPFEYQDPEGLDSSYSYIGQLSKKRCTTTSADKYDSTDHHSSTLEEEPRDFPVASLLFF